MTPKPGAVKKSRRFVQFLSMFSQLWPLSTLGRTLFLSKLSPLLLLPMCLSVHVLVLGHKKLETALTLSESKIHQQLEID